MSALKALIVIDVQNYFLNEYTKDLPRKIANFIAKNKFDFLIFTKFVNSKDSNFYRFFKWKKCFLKEETEIAEGLLTFTNKNNVFVKHTFSAFKNKKLIAFLRKNKIKEVYLCGTDTDACVLASAYDAFDLGFYVYTLKELCSSCNGEYFHSIGKELISRNLEHKPI